MADYYERTNAKFGPWAAQFLPRAFFELAPRYLGPYARFSAAFYANGHEAGAAGAARSAGVAGEEPLALALLMEGGGRLWGRYWGAREDLPGLHFDICYYRPIAYAIERGLESFDPGMGGDHKARRGFKAVVAASLHRVFDRRLAALFGRALKEASAAEEAFAAELNRELPFKARP
jgi:predicted N-acyltransferase